MKREFARLDAAFDLLVIGGGIYGAWIAYDAALRGLRVALVEREDWGAGTSSASSKLIHGGLRYLEYGRFGLVRKALIERRRLLRLAPHRVRPLRFLLPVFADARVSSWRLRLGLTLYDLLAGRHAGTPRHARFDAERIGTLAPFLAASELRAGFAYHDAVHDDARTTLEIVAGALAAGAVAVNHAAAVTLSERDGRVTGARVRDVLSDAQVEIRAAMTVNAAGPWAPALAGGAAPAVRFPGVRFTKGVHLVMPPLGRDDALLLTAPQDGRVFFLIPWYGTTLLGTTDTDHHGAPETAVISAADIDYLLTAVNARCPGLAWTPADIRGAFCGLRTLQAQAGKGASAVTREWLLSEPRPGLLMPIGGKFTSARVEAELTVTRACAVAGRHASPSETATRAFPWAPSEPWPEWLPRACAQAALLDINDTDARVLAERHGANVDTVLRLIRNDKTLGGRLHPALPFLRAEVVHAARDEQAQTLIDVLRRRLPLLLLTRWDDAVIADAAALMGRELGWDAAHISAEISALRTQDRNALPR